MTEELDVDARRVRHIHNALKDSNATRANCAIRHTYDRDVADMKVKTVTPAAFLDGRMKCPPGNRVQNIQIARSLG